MQSVSNDGAQIARRVQKALCVFFESDTVSEQLKTLASDAPTATLVFLSSLAGILFA